MKVSLSLYKQKKTLSDKNMKRDGVSPYVHMRRESAPPSCMHQDTFLDDPFYSLSCAST